MPSDLLTRVSDERLLSDVLEGLQARRKSIPSRYLYDERGSELFEAICDLPEYHVTRTESALLADVAVEIAEQIPMGAALVEFGSGASVKTRILLDEASHLLAYVPIDISTSALGAAAAEIEARYPALEVWPVEGDFTRTVDLPPEIQSMPKFGFFPGSTLGNFAPLDAEALLLRARHLLGDDAKFVVGLDLTRSRWRLLSAYDDGAGVTAAFNLNLLHRLNRELGADFEVEQFKHRVVWNSAESRVEMHLESLNGQVVSIDGERIFIARGETIHTENSYKYRPMAFAQIAARAGWKVSHQWDGNDPAVEGSAARVGIFLLQAA